MTEIRAICERCGGRCCLYPSLMPHEAAKILQVIGPVAYAAGKAGRVGENMIGFREPCPAKGDTGCKLAYKDRPLTCRLYPFMPVPLRDKNDGEKMGLLLDTSVCPHWVLFGKGYKNALKELEELKE